MTVSVTVVRRQITATAQVRHTVSVAVSTRRGPKGRDGRDGEQGPPGPALGAGRVYISGGCF